MSSLVSAMAFIRLSAPDLDIMEKFLLDFGMVRAHRDEKRLYMRGIGDAPYLHVTELGEPGMLSAAYDVDSEDVLKELVRDGMAPAVEELDGPGGGKRIRMLDPDGCTVELVSGRKKAASMPPRPNLRGPSGESKLQGAARVRRLGHTAVKSPTPRQTLAWYQEKFHLLPTDELFVGTPDKLLGQFCRVDRGPEPVDHHIIFVLSGKEPGLHHVSFEVEAVDDIFFGFNHLEQQHSDHVRGIGRHALGSQIFDYWMSPFNQMHEHWISSEKMNADSGMNYIPIGSDMAHDTGDKPPDRFVKQATPFLAWVS